MVVNADTVLISYSMQGQGYLKTINLNILSRSNAYKRQVFVPVVWIFAAPVTSTFPIGYANLGLSLDGKNSPPGRSRTLDRTIFSHPPFQCRGLMKSQCKKNTGVGPDTKTQSYVWCRNFQTSVHDGILQKKRSKFVAWIATLLKTNIAPENRFLEDYFPFGKANFMVLR